MLVENGRQIDPELWKVVFGIEKRGMVLDLEGMIDEVNNRVEIRTDLTRRQLKNNVEGTICVNVYADQVLMSCYSLDWENPDKSKKEFLGLDGEWHEGGMVDASDADEIRIYTEKGLLKVVPSVATE